MEAVICFTHREKEECDFMDGGFLDVCGGTEEYLANDDHMLEEIRTFKYYYHVILFVAQA